MKNKILLTSLLSSLLLFSCNGNLPSSDLPSSDIPLEEIKLRDTFTNKFDNEKLPNQWTEYGSGDPFVYRFNGKYYLYVSTKNFETGVRGWVSNDLISWEPITGDGLEYGYVSNDPCTVTAYAPEVIYLNGYFYMVQSQGGNGHYILRAEKPEGPFVRITDNFGESIDGSFFLDDDEQLYLLRASNSGIRLVKLNDDLSVGNLKTLDNTTLGGWTEGPYLLKNDGTYYLTYTGNNVVSDGYRIAYSYAQGDIFDRSAFSEGGTIVLSTKEDFKGLGHSSTVLGPDLDSYYLAYHNLNSSGGPDRSFNLSRLSFSGTDMVCDYVSLYDNYKPALPLFAKEDESGLVKEDKFYLSDVSSRDIFTSEYNFKGNDTSFVFSYLDNSNYAYVNIKDQTIKYAIVKDGNETTIATSSLIKTYDYSKLHTIRVSYADKKTSIHFDNMNKITVEDQLLSGGKVGYIKANDTEIFATTLSNHAFGSSSKEEVFQDVVLANNYYSSSFTSSSLRKQAPREDDEFLDHFNGKLNALDLDLKSGDAVTYRINIKDDSYYGIDMTYLTQYAGQKFLIQIDDQTPIRVKLPSLENITKDYVKTVICELDLQKGPHYITFIAEDDISFHDFSFFKSSSSWPKFEDDLQDYVSHGVKYVNSWKLAEDGHYALAGNRNLMYFGDGTFTDFTMEVDIKIVGESQASSCGIILHCDNPAFSNFDNMSSIQGYYCAFNNSKMSISKLNYNHSIIDTSAMANKFSSNEFHHLKVVSRGNHIEFTIDDEYVLEYIDEIGFSHGNIGFYTDGAASVYRNLKIYH